MGEEKTPTPQGNIETTSTAHSDRESGSLTGSGEFRKGSNMPRPADGTIGRRSFADGLRTDRAGGRCHRIDQRRPSERIGIIDPDNRRGSCPLHRPINPGLRLG